MKGCECEHSSHFGEYAPGEEPTGLEDAALDLETGAQIVPTIAGTSQHPYGEPATDDLVSFNTLYGEFRVCKACSIDHPYPAKFLIGGTDA